MQSESEKCQLIGQIDEIQTERDRHIQECMEIKSQLCMAEDKLDNFQAHLNDISRKLKECKHYILFTFALLLFNLIFFSL